MKRTINVYAGNFLSPTCIRISSQYYSHLPNTGGYYYFNGYYSDNNFGVTSVTNTKAAGIFSYHNNNNKYDGEIYHECAEAIQNNIYNSDMYYEGEKVYTNAFYKTCPYKDGQIAKVNNDYYKISISEISETNELNLWFGINSAIDLAVKNVLGSTLDNVGTNTKVCPIQLNKAKTITRNITFTKITDKSSNQTMYLTISSSRNTCGSYDIITAPYKKPDGTGLTINGLYHDPDEVLRLFQAMTTTWSNEVVYDIQVLPYCPISKINLSTISIGALTKDMDYSYASLDGTANIPYSYIFYSSSADCNYDISYNIPAITTKTDYICKKYKLVAPNFGSSYDIPVAQNWGVDTFNISMTALPYSPWIKISPVFKGLNGTNYNDSRGLILNGSLQITQLTDAFAEYQYSNSNYQSIFDRQIENSEKLYDIQKTQNIKSGIANVISSGINGASAGALASGGNPIGAAVGAVAGLGASAFGLASDLKAAEQTQSENIDYTKDQFALSMGNIKSQGTSISKITSITEANKLIPFIEYYDALDEDKAIINKKLLYNGMTINRIGTIKDYANTSDDLQYYQTKLIIPDGVDNCEYNYDYLNALGLELSKGFFADYNTIIME